MPVFPNNTAATATPIASLPFTTSGDFGGNASAVTWFSYVALATDIFPAIRLTSSVGGDFTFVEIFEGIGLGALNPGYCDPNAPIEQPITPGLTYYFRITPDDPNATITLSIEPQPLNAPQVGDLLVPDPNYGFPPVVLNLVEGGVTDVPPMRAADTADSLPDGTICFAAIKNGGGVDTIILYEPTPLGTVRASLANPIGTSYVFVAQDHVDSFFLAKSVFGGAPLTVRKVSRTGVLDATVWTLPGVTLNAFAVSVGGLIAYTSNFSVTTPIGAYDLVANMALPDFAPGIVGYKIISLAVLADDAVVAGYLKTTDQSLRVVIYESNGTTRATYDAPAGEAWVCGLAPGADDPDSLWIRTEDSALSVSHFRHLLAADLSVIEAYPTLDNFDEGIGNNLTEQDFGPSEATNFIVLRVAASPELEITKVATGSFRRGQSTGSYELAVTNVGDGATSGTVTVTETLPDSLTLISMSGTGWTCVDNVCTRNDALAAGDSYPPIIVHVTVSPTAPSTVDNTVDTTGGGSPPTNIVVHTPILAAYTLDPTTIRRVRRAPHLTKEQRVIFYPAIQVDLQPGIGNVVPPGVEPQVMLRMSRDGGQTWSPEIWMSAGKIGEYAKRVIARNLGRGRDVVFEVIVSDPNNWNLIGAYFDPDPIIGRF